MDRRRFLGAILASACAPAIVRASSLMPIRAPALPTGLILNESGIAVVDWKVFYSAVVLNNAFMARVMGENMRDALEQNVYRTLTNAS